MAEYKTARTWPYFLVGAVLGAVGGILFAKKPGEETREKLVDWIKVKREEGEGFLAKWRARSAQPDQKEHSHRKREFINS